MTTNTPINTLHFELLAAAIALQASWQIGGSSFANRWDWLSKVAIPLKVGQ